MSESTFLELVEGVGVETDFLTDPKTGLEIPNPKAGDPAALIHEGINIPVPTVVGDDVVTTTRSATIAQRPEIKDNWYDSPVDAETGVLACARIVPGTRIIETNAPPVVSVLLDSGHYVICDPPTSEQPRRPRKSETETPATAGQEG